MKLNFCFALFLSCLVSAASAAEAFSWKKFKNLYAGFGTWQEFYMQTQATQSGDLNGFEFRPFFAAAVDYELTKKHLILPELGYVLRQEISGGAVTKDQFFFRFDYGYRALDWLTLRVGTSLIWVWYNGDGSERTFPNGNSSEVYYAPSESANTFNQTFDLGAEFIQKRFSFRVGSYIYAVNAENERLTSFSLGINYRIPLEDIWKK